MVVHSEDIWTIPASTQEFVQGERSLPKAGRSTQADSHPQHPDLSAPPSQASPFIDSKNVNIRLVPPCNISPITTGRLFAATSGISTVKPLSLTKKIEEM